MKGNTRIVQLLNDYLTLELTAINQYFVHAKMMENWGYARLARKLREDSLAEMKDAEELVERILYFEGIPNLARLGAVVVGETPVEQLRLALEAERESVRKLTEGIAACLEEGDQGTREFLAGLLSDEEEHIDWLETQLTLIEQIGEQSYLSQQVRE